MGVMVLYYIGLCVLYYDWTLLVVVVVVGGGVDAASASGPRGASRWRHG